MATEVETGPVENEPEEQPRRRKLTVIIVIGFLVAVIGGCTAISFAFCGPSDEEKAEQRRLGQHCLLGAEHFDVSLQVRNYLHDSDSFEFVSGFMTAVDAEGYHEYTMEYRARNAFGAMMKATAIAIVENDGCDATVISYE